MLLKCDMCQEFISYSMCQAVTDLTASCLPIIVAVQGLLCTTPGKQFHYLQPEGFIGKPPKQVSNAANFSSSSLQKGILISFCELCRAPSLSPQCRSLPPLFPGVCPLQPSWKAQVLQRVCVLVLQGQRPSCPTGCRDS